MSPPPPPQHQEELAAELAAALRGDIGPWKAALEQRRWTDPFKAIRADKDQEHAIAAAAGFDDVVSWLTKAGEWVHTMHVPGVEPSPGELVLRVAWEFFERRLSASLGRARKLGRLPVTGAVLAFVDGLDVCLIVDYRFVGDVTSLRVINAIDSPRTVFDVADALLRLPHETRTEFKRMFQSSHRLVWHRDILIHVDRREEPLVFGPSIDTLHVAELIVNRYAAVPPNEQPARVLELGTGSGLLTASVLRNISGTLQLAGVEIDPVAAFCTHRNWQVNTDDLPGVLDRKAALVVGPFRPQLLAGSYDLVICNPPYIPNDPAEARAAQETGRHGAVANLELLDGLLGASAKLVNPGGSILLVVSSVTPPAYVQAPDGFTADWVWGEDGMSVHFEVEEVFSRPGWLQRLLDAGGLTLSGDYYEHRLHAVWLTRTEAM